MKKNEFEHTVIVYYYPRNKEEEKTRTNTETTEKVDVASGVNPLKIPHDIEYYVKKIAERRKWKKEKMLNYLSNLYTISPGAVFSILLREIAIELDKHYEDHISESPEIYIVSTSDGGVYRTNKKSIATFKYFAAFRCENDAQTACAILHNLWEKMFLY